jgi:predicted secreted protein
VGKAGLALPGWALSLIVTLAPGIAGAAESAHFNALGYSGDNRYFAFEQFGTQDGSGFPYSDIFLIDLDSDSFVGGTPIRVRIDDDTANLSAARQEAFAKAGEALNAHGILNPAVPIALRGDGEFDDDGLALSYGIPLGLAGTHGRYDLSLEIFKAPSAMDCQYFEGEPMGYALLREIDGEITEIHRDTRVPSSRLCVVTYKFYGVFLPFGTFDNSSAVAVLSVWSHGFEGPDRRFIALPVGDR